MTHHDDTLKEFDEKFYQRELAKAGAPNELAKQLHEHFAGRDNDIKQFLTARALAYQNLLVERIKGMRPTRPYPNASNGYSSEFTAEEEAEDKVLSDIIVMIKGM